MKLPWPWHPTRLARGVNDSLRERTLWCPMSHSGRFLPVASDPLETKTVAGNLGGAAARSLKRIGRPQVNDSAARLLDLGLTKDKSSRFQQGAAVGGLRRPNSTSRLGHERTVKYQIHP
jgi:hypothetical protein